MRGPRTSAGAAVGGALASAVAAAATRAASSFSMQHFLYLVPDPQ